MPFSGVEHASGAGRPDVAADLIEYLVVSIPDTEAVDAVAAELTEAVAASLIRILDLAVITVADGGRVELLGPELVPALRAVRDVTVPWGVILSRHDLELIGLSLHPGSCALVVVVEDRWAEPLAAAVRGSGGRVHAGERIARERVELAWAHRDDRREEPTR